VNIAAQQLVIEYDSLISIQMLEFSFEFQLCYFWFALCI